MGECINALSKLGRPSSSKKSTGSVVNFFATSGPIAVLLNKEGFFVIMAEEMSSEKKTAAVNENFKTGV